jgi:hypothetical protein
LEEGIGIIAGSLPALRPLLSLRIRVTTTSQSPAASGNAYLSASHSKPRPRPNIMLDTFQTLGDNDIDHSDGDSQRNIMKETKYTVTSDRMPSSHAQEMNWDHKSTNFV